MPISATARAAMHPVAIAHLVAQARCLAVAALAIGTEADDLGPHADTFENITRSRSVTNSARVPVPPSAR